MRGARFVTAIEADAGRRMSESTIKSLTGGDTITARFMRAEYFEFKPQFKLWLAANHKPEIRGTDLAIWRRVKLIPFTVTIPEDEQDPDLPAKLAEELPGILTWAVEGCRAWRENGLGTCAAVEAHTAEYRNDQDVLQQFIEQECTIGKGLAVAKKDLYARYKTWSDENGEHPITQRKFSTNLREKVPEVHESRVGQNRNRAWTGIETQSSQFKLQ